MLLSCTILLALTAACPTDTAPALDRHKLERQLERHEGRRTEVYLDSVGVPTIGIGFNLVREDAKAKITALGLDYQRVLDGRQQLTEEQVSQLFQADVSAAIDDARELVPNFADLGDVRQRVLTDMSFNLGRRRLAGFRRMLAAVADGDFQRAADEMKDSKWYRQVKSRGVTLVEMMRSNRDPAWLGCE